MQLELFNSFISLFNFFLKIIIIPSKSNFLNLNKSTSNGPSSLSLRGVFWDLRLYTSFLCSFFKYIWLKYNKIKDCIPL